jgi:hypothetical protein
MFDLQANTARFTLEIASFTGELRVVGFEGEAQRSKPVRASLRARRQAIVRVVVWLGKGAPFPAPHA